MFVGTALLLEPILDRTSRFWEYNSQSLIHSMLREPDTKRVPIGIIGFGINIRSSSRFREYYPQSSTHSMLREPASKWVPIGTGGFVNTDFNLWIKSGSLSLSVIDTTDMKECEPCLWHSDLLVAAIQRNEFRCCKMSRGSATWGCTELLALYYSGK